MAPMPVLRLSFCSTEFVTAIKLYDLLLDARDRSVQQIYAAAHMLQYWHYSHSVRQGLCNGTASVCPSVCLSCLSTTAVASPGYNVSRGTGWRRNNWRHAHKMTENAYTTCLKNLHIYFNMWKHGILKLFDIRDCRHTLYSSTVK